MAVKSSYGVRTAMLASTMDTEITLQKDGVGLRPLPIKFIILTILSGIVCLKVLTGNFIGAGNLFQKALFVVMWVAMTILLFMNDKTKRMNIQKLISAINYFSIGSNRNVETRRTDPANGMLDICNISSVEEDGLINFCDKTVGYMYRITGSASVLLFDEDKDSIVNAVDGFYRKVESDTEFIFLTLKESQKVYNQAAAIQKRYNNLSVKDPELTDLLDKQLIQLRDIVGKRYLSIHQYMIIKSNSQEALTKAKVTVQGELDGGALMIRRCIPLDDQEILEQLSTIYTVPKWDSVK